MRAVTAVALCASLLFVAGSFGSIAQADQSPAPQAAVCQSSVGPGIPPPATVASGVPGFHASWYGQSGYMTLCPGDTMTAVVAMYNSGSFGWVKGVLGQVAYLGTWNPIPGQDQPSVLGGDGQLGSPNTGWPRYNRVAIQPADYVGPNQIAWFQFGIRAPQTPGIYDLYIRPVIEGAQWMEDYGIFWRITVPASTVGAPAKLGCSASPASIVAGSSQSSTITVTVQDASGQTVTTDSGTAITLSQAGVTGSLDGGPLGAASTKSTASGVVTFALTQPMAGSTGTDQLSAGAATLTGCFTNVAFTTAGAPASVGVTLGQNAFPSGSPHATTVVATLKDATGATAIAQTDETVTFSVDNNGICTVSPASATISTGSSSTSTTLTTSGAPGSCTVTASVPSLQSGSATATVSASGPAAKLAITANTCSNTPTTSASPLWNARLLPFWYLCLYLLAGVAVAEVGAALTAMLVADPARPSALARAVTPVVTVVAVLGWVALPLWRFPSWVPGGWYPDPLGQGAARYWDGKRWTLEYRDDPPPNPIPANGSSQSTATVCVKDAANNTVTSATDSIELVFTSSTGGSAHGTTLVSSSPQIASAGCASFFVKSTTTAATDTYTANDLSRSITSTTVSITTQ